MAPYCRREEFDLMMTMPYLPNTLVAFLKVPNAFHGVEAIRDQNIRRHLLLYDIKTKAVAPVSSPPIATGAKNVQFTF
jgi:hypothetical protein